METSDLDILCCPSDKSDLIITKEKATCSLCHQVYSIKNNIFTGLPHLSDATKLSVEKWDKLYEKEQDPKKYQEEQKKYLKLHYPDVHRQVNQEKKIKNIVYLEIGCGPAFFGQEIAKSCKLVIGIDFSKNALRIAKQMFDRRGITNYLLIHGDILHLPIKKDTVDLIYGGGVIEHFTETQQCVDELYRVLKPSGVSFNTVPYLNLGSLTYRQVWGNIPNVPILKQLAELIHIKFLKSKHMIFGYEMSFLASTLKKIHGKAGFKKVSVTKFEVYLVFDFLPPLIRRPFIWLAKNSRLFWPMVKVVAQK